MRQLDVLSNPEYKEQHLIQMSNFWYKIDLIEEDLFENRAN